MSTDIKKGMFRLSPELSQQIRLVAVMDHRRYNEVLEDAVRMYLKVRYPNKWKEVKCK